MISIKNLNKKYGNLTVYENFNLRIEKGKITVILGESGSGKTTLLNVLANLTDYQGEVVGVDKNISFVFQKDRLISNLTVAQNLTLINPSINVDLVLDEYGILDKKDKYPKTLSGGQARRLAIARALNVNASTVFMDEPFINLDVKLKYQLINKIKEQQQKVGSTVIVVTHDVKEAVSIADRIIVLSKGNIVLDQKTVNK
ncbi:MAG: ATP-binding cassette domain-containing protein, partial [Clostridia bacterium]|nr:ATP-binding cassette domain-containing protein [Clostridia bacterium]